SLLKGISEPDGFLTTIDKLLSRQLLQARGFPKGPWRSVSTMFKAADLQIELSKHPKEKPDSSKLVFGKSFSDHMLTIEWSAEKGWDRPHIKPLQNLSLHPASSVLHYSIEVSNLLTVTMR
ncbi:hypothetical protein scyTo_0022050, partial [Scyliorhinus torazame]|nr:hypothetical protein [Scyliorhinus torazame]